MRFYPVIAAGALALVGALGLAAMTNTRIPVPAFNRDYVLRFDLSDLMTRASNDELPPIEGPSDPSLPLVVIDAGHGGRDPGAVHGKVREKEVTLALALALKRALLEQGNVRVALTRSDDRLIALPRRAELARELGADLFVSIHADSTAGDERARGASVYTLSRRASSAAARRFAQRENRADEINGMSIKGQDPKVSRILVELSQRKAGRDASELARLMLREGEGRIAFLSDPLRSADLVVLRSPDLPSVLFEAGFVTSQSDSKRLLSKEGQREIAEILARAIEIYLIRRRDAP